MLLNLILNGIDHDMQIPILFLQHFAVSDEVGDRKMYVIYVQLQSFEVLVSLQAVNKLKYLSFFDRATKVYYFLTFQHSTPNGSNEPFYR